MHCVSKRSNKNKRRQSRKNRYSRNIHERFETKMAQNAHGYCVQAVLSMILELVNPAAAAIQV
jgi:hypothetical protein